MEERLYDEQYIAGYTENFEELKERIREFTPEKMAAVCGIDAETLREVARLYARSRASLIFWGMGVSQHVHGTDNARCLIALALITGQIGRPGTGLHPLRGQNNVQGASDAGLIPMVYPDYQSVENADRPRPVRDVLGPVARSEARPDRRRDHARDPCRRRSGACSSRARTPRCRTPTSTTPAHALAMLDHLVVQDLFLTETAFHADVVLPASAFAEKGGTLHQHRPARADRPSGRPAAGRRPPGLVDHPGTRQPPGPVTGPIPSPADIFAEMAQVMPSLNNITWERLEREGAVTYPVDAPDQPGNEIIFYAGFPTESGRAKIVPANIVSPDEVPDTEYPMILSTGRVLEHWHTGSMTRRSGVLDALEPEAVALMSPRELHRLGLEPGDTMRLATRRGAINVKVRSDRDVPVGHDLHAVLLRRGRREPPDEPCSRSVREDPGVQVLRGTDRDGLDRN